MTGKKTKTHGEGEKTKISTLKESASPATSIACLPCTMMVLLASEIGQAALWSLPDISPRWKIESKSRYGENSKIHHMKAHPTLAMA